MKKRYVLATLMMLATPWWMIGLLDLVTPDDGRLEWYTQAAQITIVLAFIPWLLSIFAILDKED